MKLKWRNNYKPEEIHFEVKLSKKMSWIYRELTNTSIIKRWTNTENRFRNLGIKRNTGKNRCRNCYWNRTLKSREKVLIEYIFTKFWCTIPLVKFLFELIEKSRINNAYLFRHNENVKSYYKALDNLRNVLWYNTCRTISLSLQS